MITYEEGRKFYMTAELADGTYDVRGNRTAEYTDRIREAGRYIRQNSDRELQFIDFFRKRFAGCDWKNVYPLTEEELLQCIEVFTRFK